MRKYGKELEKDTGKWIDSSVWHGKPHTWDKVKWLIEQVCATDFSYASYGWLNITCALSYR